MRGKGILLLIFLAHRKEKIHYFWNCQGGGSDHPHTTYLKTEALPSYPCPTRGVQAQPGPTHLSTPPPPRVTNLTKKISGSDPRVAAEMVTLNTEVPPGRGRASRWGPGTAASPGPTPGGPPPAPRTPRRSASPAPPAARRPPPQAPQCCDTAWTSDWGRVRQAPVPGQRGSCRAAPFVCLDLPVWSSVRSLFAPPPKRILVCSTACKRTVKNAGTRRFEKFGVFVRQHPA